MPPPRILLTFLAAASRMSSPKSAFFWRLALARRKSRRRPISRLSCPGRTYDESETPQNLAGTWGCATAGVVTRSKFGQRKFARASARPVAVSSIARIASRRISRQGSEVYRINDRVENAQLWQQATTLKYVPSSHPEVPARGDVDGRLHPRGGRCIAKLRLQRVGRMPHMVISRRKANVD